MKKKFLLFIGGIVLFLFIFVTALAWSKIFYGSSSGGNTTGILNIQLSRKTDYLDTTQAHPSSTAPSDTKPYTFVITNQSRNDSHYQVLLEEEPLSNQKGHRQEDLLKRNQLKYELSLNGKVIHEGILSDIKNNILDERIIQGKQENQYQT